LRASREALLAEYQACEDAEGSDVFRGWQVVSIVYGAAFAGLVFLVTANPGLATSVATTGIALVAIGMVAGARWIVKRASFSISRTWMRMRDIEWHLGMRKNIYLSILADWGNRATNPDWQRLPDEEKALLGCHYSDCGRGMPGPKATPLVVDWGAYLLCASWLLLIAWRWLEYKGVLDSGPIGIRIVG